MKALDSPEPLLASRFRKTPARLRSDQSATQSGISDYTPLRAPTSSLVNQLRGSQDVHTPAFLNAGVLTRRKAKELLKK